MTRSVIFHWEDATQLGAAAPGNGVIMTRRSHRTRAAEAQIGQALFATVQHAFCRPRQTVDGWQNRHLPY